MLVSVGDQVRITEGFKSFGNIFKNNDTSKVAAMTDDRITLDDGRWMPRDFVHLDQGVCITSYAAECRGVHTMIGLAPLAALSKMDAKAFYVMVSRESHRVKFFTDLKEAFKDAAMRDGDRTAVSDYGSLNAPANMDLQPGKRVKSQAQKLVNFCVQLARRKSPSHQIKVTAPEKKGYAIPAYTIDGFNDPDTRRGFRI
jgi:hypothetical protein